MIERNVVVRSSDATTWSMPALCLRYVKESFAHLSSLTFLRSPLFVRRSYWYGFTFVLFYLSDTLCNVPYNAFGPVLTEDTVERSNMYFVQNVFGMVGTLVGAAGPPGVEMSFGISKEWSFCIVGLFFGGWFVCTQMNLVWSLKERPESQKQKPVPLVASMNRAFRNGPFATLLFASFLDSVG